MKAPLRILLVEDAPLDVALVEQALKRGGVRCDLTHVADEPALIAALADGTWDAILSDYQLPGFDGRSVLQRTLAVHPHTPFIFISGTMGEEVAVEALKSGATDYVVKDRLDRIIPTLQRALKEAEERRQRLAIEQALKDSERRYRLLADNAGDVIFTLDPGLRYTYVSPAVKALRGFEPAEVLQQSLSDVLTPHSLELVQRALGEEMARSQAKPGGPLHPRILELEVRRKDGTTVWSEVKVSLICDAQGRLEGFLGVARDITQHRRIGERLRLQSAALEAAANAMYLTDATGAILWVNPAFTALTGYSFDDAVGKNPRDLIKSDKHDRAFYKTLWDIILSGEVWHGQIVNRRKDGTLYTEEQTITPVRDEQGRITHFIAIQQDITERQRLETLLLRNQRLESVGRLASGIAHDLNNVLAPMLMAPSILRESLKLPDDLRLLDTIESSAQRGAAIIRQLLTFARGTAGERVPVQLRFVLRDTVKIIQETFPKSISVVRETPKESWPVNGDANQLHEVLMHLCFNARDAMPDGGRLTLGLENHELDEAFVRKNPGTRSGRFVVLSVTDTGTGIPSEYLDRIYDPFFTTKPVGQGTGLGLSSVLGIVKSHNGFIQVASEVGQGTQFKVFLPACEAPEPVVPQGATPTPRGQGQTVLVVDDEENLRLALGRILERHGYKVLEAADGSAGLARFNEHRGEIDLVMTDLLMPFMDGAAFIEALRRTDPEVPILVVSGHQSESGLSTELDSQIQGFLPKPFRIEALLQTLHLMLHPSSPPASDKKAPATP